MTSPLSLAIPPELRIPRVPKRITEEVEAQDGQADGQAGEDGEPRRRLHERAPGARQHQAPRGWRRLRADGEQSDPERDAGAVDDPAQDVAADVVGPERVRPARRG